jgi:hypothetical protein
MHIARSKNKHSHKDNWIKKVLRQGDRPQLVILEKVNFSEWVEREKFWINSFKAEFFDLTNSTPGGEGVNSFNAITMRSNQKKNMGEMIGATFKNGAWETYVNINSYRVYLGRFQNEIDAAEAYDIAMRYFYGNYFPFNFEKEHQYVLNYKIDFDKVPKLKSIENYCWCYFFCSGYDFIEQCKNENFIDNKQKKEIFEYYNQIMDEIRKYK